MPLVKISKPNKSPTKVDDDYFKNNFNTKLDSMNERAFNDWAAMRSEQHGRDVLQDLHDYDLRGYWLSEGYKDTEGGTKHGPDTFKKPNHPTFSNESIYHGEMSPFNKPWEGGRWGKDSYTPSKTMLEHTHDKLFLANYFRTREPKIKLVFPK